MSWTKISILHSQGRNAPGCRSLPLRPSSLPFPLSVLAWIVSKMNQTRSCALKRPTLAELQYVWDDNCRNGSQCLLFTSLELAGSGLEGGIICLCCCSCCCCCCCCCQCCCCRSRKLFPSKFNSGSSFIFFSNFCATRWPWRFLRSWVSLSLSLSLSLSVFLIVLFEKGRRRERSVFNLMQLHCCCQCCCCCSCCCKCCCPGFFVLNSGRTTIAKKQLWSPLLQPRIRRGQ